MEYTHLTEDEQREIHDRMLAQAEAEHFQHTVALRSAEAVAEDPETDEACVATRAAIAALELRIAATTDFVPASVPEKAKTKP